jgi:8-oxo-dGTP pyrophosphatase MutT (NUDIX family)
MDKKDFNVETSAGNFSYRAVALIIKDNNLLVAKHINYNCYYTVGGGIMLNESSCEAAIREALEETGYLFEIDRLIYIHERFYLNNNINQHEVAFYYLMKQIENLEIKEGSFTDQGSNETLHWLPTKNLSDVKLVPEFLKCKLQNISNPLEHIITYE